VLGLYNQSIPLPPAGLRGKGSASGGRKLKKLRASRPDAFFKELRGSIWSLDAPAPLELRGEASMQPQGTKVACPGGACIFPEWGMLRGKASMQPQGTWGSSPADAFPPKGESFKKACRACIRRQAGSFARRGDAFF